MATSPRSVLLVEADAQLRDRLGGWLERSGFDVLQCPGPTGPSYTCLISRGKACALAKAADVVVLDLWLHSDSVMLGTTATELLAYYLTYQRPVVVIDPGHDELLPFVDEVAARIEWPPERRELIESVQVALAVADQGLKGNLDPDRRSLAGSAADIELPTH
jgi:CheY-like chemotaxis protein